MHVQTEGRAPGQGAGLNAIFTMTGQTDAMYEARLMPLRSRMETVGLWLTAGAILLWPTIFNGFPLIFPDSGTYLGIAYGHEYALDRSSFYGLLLKPLVTSLPRVAGLWLGVAGQALAVSAVLILAASQLCPRATGIQLLGCIIVTTLLTSLAWHSAQYMPDAFTGPVLLLAWLAASRDPAAPGAALLWLAAIVLALTHYTHLVLLGAGAGAGILAHAACGLRLRDIVRRAVAAAVAVAAVAGVLIAANRLALGRSTISPMGSLFLYARLNEDGLVPVWLDRHCGRDAPAALCALRGSLPRDSQKLLWGGAATPLTALVWHDVEGTRWQWIDMMGVANRGAIAEAPLAFAQVAATGSLRQFISFAALDDECPVGCRDLVGGINYTLNKYRPETVAALQASRQVQDTTGKAFVRMMTTPVAALSLLLLPIALVSAWRRRDAVALSLLAAVATGLVTNAMLAGALSDVHDRYQSRVVWLVPFVLLLVAAKWNHTFRRSRISLPGLK